MKVQLAAVGVAGAIAQVSAQTAQISVYPGNTETSDVSGNVTVTVGETETTLSGTVTGTFANPDCSEGCGVHVHEGVQCGKDRGHFGHFGDDDPWATATYEIEEGKAVVNVAAEQTAANGHDNIINFIGRTITLHNNEDRAACGKILPDGLGETVIAADLAVYPGFGLAQAKLASGIVKIEEGSAADKVKVTIPADYTDGKAASLKTYSESTCDSEIASIAFATGVTEAVDVEIANVQTETEFEGVFVQVDGEDDCHALVAAPTIGYVTAKASEGKVTVQGTLSGSAKNLDTSTGGHGFHVHEGDSCENDGGHLKVGDVDPYAGWKYTSNVNGIATADKTTDTDVEFSSIFNKPVVFHSIDGIKVACGVLSEIVATDEPTTTDKPTTAEPTTGAASAAALSAFAFGPALYAAYNAL